MDYKNLCEIYPKCGSLSLCWVSYKVIDAEQNEIKYQSERKELLLKTTMLKKNQIEELSLDLDLDLEQDVKC